MRFELTVNAYDVMGEIWLSLVLRGDPASTEPGEPQRLCRTTVVRGTGENDPIAWATDVLVAMLEAL